MSDLLNIGKLIFGFLTFHEVARHPASGWLAMGLAQTLAFCRLAGA